MIIMTNPAVRLTESLIFPLLGPLLSPIRLLILAVLLMTTGFAAEDTYPPGVSVALKEYEAAVQKAEAGKEKAVGVAKVVLNKLLEDEKVKATKAGNLELATLIKALIDDPVAPRQDGALSLASNETEIKFPKGIMWREIDNKKGIATCYTMGTFPKGSDASEVTKYAMSGDYKNGLLGVKVEVGTANASGVFNCPKTANADTYWFVFLRAKKAVVEIAVNAEAETRYGSNKSDVYLDGRPIEKSSKITITPKGHVLVLRQQYNFAETGAWIKVAGSDVLVGTPK